MIINKLSNICSYTEGYVNPEITNENYFSENGMPWLKVADLVHGENIYFTKYHLSPLGESLAKNENQIFKKGTIVWSKSGSIGLTSILQINVMANRGILNIKPNNKYVKNKYLFYFLYKNKNIFSSKGTGIVLKHFYGPNLMNEEINLPNIKMQNQIIDIIEQNETLFLKYSNCIRIDTLENVQTDMKNLIEIVKPFELYENKILNIIKFIEKSFFFRSFEINNFIKENINWKSAGYTYKYSDKNLHGVYKIFTVKNINNKFKFEKTNITKNNLINIGDVITGLSGTIGTASIVYENNWVSNQRTLVLRSNIPLNIKIAIIKQNNFLIKHATGAVQKNITIDDILNLKMIKKTANDEYINEFYIKFLILKNKIKEIKKSIINLLIK